MRRVSSVETSNGWYILVRVHDRIWADRTNFDADTRLCACMNVDVLILRCVIEESKKRELARAKKGLHTSAE